MNLLKYPIFLFILFIHHLCNSSAGGLKTIDLFYYTDQGISLHNRDVHDILCADRFLRLCPASRKRAFCHYSAIA